MDKQTVRQLRQLMQTPQWGALEFAFNQYLKENFLDSSMKRDNEFETLWAVSFSEGGKYHLKKFFNMLEEEVANLNN